MHLKNKPFSSYLFFCIFSFILCNGIFLPKLSLAEQSHQEHNEACQECIDKKRNRQLNPFTFFNLRTVDVVYTVTIRTTDPDGFRNGTLAIVNLSSRSRREDDDFIRESTFQTTRLRNRPQSITFTFNRTLVFVPQGLLSTLISAVNATIGDLVEGSLTVKVEIFNSEGSLIETFTQSPVPLVAIPSNSPDVEPFSSAGANISVIDL